jgi:hypothetical protein
MTFDSIDKYLIEHAGLKQVESPTFRERMNRLIEEPGTFTAWEASQFANAPLIVGHPGLRHEQTGHVVHALLAPHLASGAFHVEVVHTRSAGRSSGRDRARPHLGVGGSSGNQTV